MAAPPRSTTSTLVTLAASAIRVSNIALPQQATATTSSTLQTHNLKNKADDNDTTANIIFGVFAIVLALIGILLAWLQIRHYQQRRLDEERVDPTWPQIQMQVVETTFTRHKTLRLPSHYHINNDSKAGTSPIVTIDEDNP